MLVGLPARGARAKDPEPYEKALEFYETEIQQPSLLYRTWARYRLARTKDPRALEILSKTYRRPEDPEDQVRYLIAYIAGDHLNTAPCIPGWETLLRKHKKPEHAYLWYQGLRVRLVLQGSTEALALLPAKANDFHRCAAILSHLAGKPEEIAALIDATLADLPKDSTSRGMTLGSLAVAAMALKPKIKDATLHPPVKRLILQIDEETTPPWARLTIARHVSWLLDLPQVTLKTLYLLDALDGTNAARPTEGRTVAPPRFMGLEASGERICYVIDLSDSMLKPLTDAEKADLKGPVTGRPGSASGQGVEERLDWSKIHTRFDAAREFLRISLLDLPRDKCFAVVWFGDEAGLLKGCKGMQRASKALVRKVIRSLQDIEPGPPTQGGMGPKGPIRARPLGTLRGDTNLHAGMMHAFSVLRPGESKGHAYVDRKGLVEGCDTVFLLSDGVPTTDNWPGTRQVTGDSDGRSRDRETGETIDSGPRSGARNVNVQGPYASAGMYLEADVRRMNMFRRAEIHCIGIGEANMGLLSRLSRSSLGKSRKIGKEPGHR